MKRIVAVAMCVGILLGCMGVVVGAADEFESDDYDLVEYEGSDEQEIDDSNADMENQFRYLRREVTRLSNAITRYLDSNTVEEYEEPPPIHELMETGEGPRLRSIITQPNYPYTGGAFMALNTNYGNGLLAVPEPYKVSTFGFVKNTDRVVNLTNSTINGYWIMGGTTYNARIVRYGEIEYQYTTSGTTQWRTLTVSALTDSNIQFLDETGERGIQRPYFSLESRLVLVLIVFEILIHAAMLVRGGRS